MGYAIGAFNDAFTEQHFQRACLVNQCKLKKNKCRKYMPKQDMETQL